MNNKAKAEIEDFVFCNYEDLRNELVVKYNTFSKVKETHEAIFEPDITKQFVDLVHSFVSTYIHSRTMVSFEDAKVYTEDKFTFDNIERIISEDGKI